MCFYFYYRLLHRYDENEAETLSTENTESENNNGNNKVSKVQQKNEQYVQSLLSRVKGKNSKNILYTSGAEDVKKLKLGLQIETRRWRAEAEKLMGVKIPSVGVSEKYFSSSQNNININNNNNERNILNFENDEKSRFRPLNNLKKNIDMVILKDSEKQNNYDNSNLNNNNLNDNINTNNNLNNLNNQMNKKQIDIQKAKNKRMSSNTAGVRWKSSLDLINNAHKNTKIGTKTVISSGAENDKINVGIFESLKTVIKGKNNMVENKNDGIKNNEKDGNSKNGNRKSKSNGNKDENTVSPNYALLIHACLMLSLSTYNLKVRQPVCPSCKQFSS